MIPIHRFPILGLLGAGRQGGLHDRDRRHLGEDGRREDRLGRLMRHFLLMTDSVSVAILSGGVMETAYAAGLITPTGSPQARPPGKLGAPIGAVPAPPITEATQEEDLSAGNSSTGDKPK